MTLPRQMRSIHARKRPGESTIHRPGPTTATASVFSRCVSQLELQVEARACPALPTKDLPIKETAAWASLTARRTLSRAGCGSENGGARRVSNRQGHPPARSCPRTKARGSTSPPRALPTLVETTIMYPPLFMRLISLDADTFFRSLLYQRRRKHP